MNRRTFLGAAAASGIAATTGCLGFGGSPSPIRDQSIEVLERGCEERQNTASLDYDETENRLRMTGTLSGTQRCGELTVSPVYSEQSDYAIIEVIPLDTSDCSNCTRYYEYEAAVSFRERPSSLVLYHSGPGQLGDGWPLDLNDTSSDTA